MPGPSHSSRFYHPNKIWWAVQIIKLLITYFSPLPCYFVPPRTKYSLQNSSSILHFAGVLLLSGVCSFVEATEDTTVKCTCCT
jgi:hypothetical protein